MDTFFGIFGIHAISNLFILGIFKSRRENIRNIHHLDQ